MRGRGLPGCGSGVTVPISAKPQPSAEHGVRHARVLVEAGGDADRIGQCQAAEAQRQGGMVGRGGARKKPELQRFERHLVRRFRRREAHQAGGEVERSVQHWQMSSGRIGTAVCVEHERTHADRERRRQLGVEVREEFAAARWFPSQRTRRAPRLELDQHEIVLAPEMFAECARELVVLRQMDEAVAPVVGGPGKRTAPARVLPRCARHHLEHALRPGGIHCSALCRIAPRLVARAPRRRSEQLQ